MEYGYIHKFANDALKYWKLPLFLFMVFFVVALYAVNQVQEDYCDEALVILGTVHNYSGREVEIENPYVAEARLNSDIAGIDDSISGTAIATTNAFDLAKRRVVKIKLKGNDPYAVRHALKNILAKFSETHHELYVQAVQATEILEENRAKKRMALEKIISILSSEKSIPVGYYEKIKDELTELKGTQMTPPVQTTFEISGRDKAKLCEAKLTALERIFSPFSWGVIGSLLGIFGLHLCSNQLARRNRK